jgi:hypothetical protein
MILVYPSQAIRKAASPVASIGTRFLSATIAVLSNTPTLGQFLG